MDGKGLAVGVQPAADSRIAPDDFAVLVAEKGVVDICLEVAEHRAEADHLLGISFYLGPLREELVGRRRGVERCPSPDAATLAGKRLPTHPLLRIVFGSLDLAEGERYAFQDTPDNRADAKAKGRFGKSQKIEASPVILFDEVMGVDCRLIKVLKDHSRRRDACEDDLLERGEVFEVP